MAARTEGDALLSGTADGTRPMKSAHLIAARLRERIVRGEVGAGDPLPVEAQLVEEFGVSRSVLREALRVLEHEGLLEIRRGVGGGPRVRHPSIASASRAVGIHLQLRDASIGDVWDTHTDLVAAALRHLGDLDVDLVTLDQHVDHLEALVGDPDVFYAQIVQTAEEAVRLAGGTTAHILVSALRHIVVAELAAATRTAEQAARTEAAERPDWADEAERSVVAVWREIQGQLRSRDGERASRHYLEASHVIGTGLMTLLGDRPVLDVFARQVRQSG